MDVASLLPSIVTAGVAAIAIVANSVVASRSLANQRRLAREQRSWDAVKELYVDLLVQSDQYMKAIVHTMGGGENNTWPLDRDQLNRLQARVAAFASDEVKRLHSKRVAAYSQYARAIVDDLAAHPGLDLGSIPHEESTWDPCRIAYLSAENDLLAAIRKELSGMRSVEI